MAVAAQKRVLPRVWASDPASVGMRLQDGSLGRMAVHVGRMPAAPGSVFKVVDAMYDGFLPYARACAAGAFASPHALRVREVLDIAAPRAGQRDRVPEPFRGSALALVEAEELLAVAEVAAELTPPHMASTWAAEAVHAVLTGRDEALRRAVAEAGRLAEEEVERESASAEFVVDLVAQIPGLIDLAAA